MTPGEWHHGDRDGLPQDGQSAHEHAAAVDAAQRLLAGPSVVVPRAVLFELTALLRQAAVLLERALDEARVPPVAGDDDPAH
jgi:hypothetical protein